MSVSFTSKQTLVLCDLIAYRLTDGFGYTTNYVDLSNFSHTSDEYKLGWQALNTYDRFTEAMAVFENAKDDGNCKKSAFQVMRKHHHELRYLLQLLSSQ